MTRLRSSHPGARRTHLAHASARPNRRCRLPFGRAQCWLATGGRMRLCRSQRNAFRGLASSRRCCATATGYCYVTDLPSVVGIPTSGTCPVGTSSPGNCLARHLLESFERSWASTSRRRRVRPCKRFVPTRSICRFGWSKRGRGLRPTPRRTNTMPSRGSPKTRSENCAWLRTVTLGCSVRFLPQIESDLDRARALTGMTGRPGCRNIHGARQFGFRTVGTAGYMTPMPRSAGTAAISTATWLPYPVAAREPTTATELTQISRRTAIRRSHSSSKGWCGQSGSPWGVLI